MRKSELASKLRPSHIFLNKNNRERRIELLHAQHGYSLISVCRNYLIDRSMKVRRFFCTTSAFKL